MSTTAEREAELKRSHTYLDDADLRLDAVVVHRHLGLSDHPLLDGVCDVRNHCSRTERDKRLSDQSFSK